MSSRAKKESGQDANGSDKWTTDNEDRRKEEKGGRIIKSLYDFKGTEKFSPSQYK